MLMLAKGCTCHLEQLCHELVGDCKTITKGIDVQMQSLMFFSMMLEDNRHWVEWADHATTNNCCTVCSEKYRQTKLSDLYLSNKNL